MQAGRRGFRRGGGLVVVVVEVEVPCAGSGGVPALDPDLPHRLQ